MTKQENEKLELTSNDIFTELLKKEIPFAVMVSVNSWKGSNDYYSRHYHLLLHKTDTTKIKGFQTFPNSLTIDDLCEKSMCSNDIEKFKEKITIFHKVKHDNSGRIYELKGNPFKEYFKAQPPIPKKSII